MLFAGALAGSLAGALNGLISSTIHSHFQIAASAATPMTWRRPTLLRQLVSLAVHLLAGLALSFLFWLSWGLTAIISVSWWTRGLSFAALTWVALCCPLLALQILNAQLPARFFSQAARESLISCVVVGMACAWNWAKGP